MKPSHHIASAGLAMILAGCASMGDSGDGMVRVKSPGTRFTRTMPSPLSPMLAQPARIIARPALAM